MRLLGVCSLLLVFVSPVTRRLQRVLTPAWTTLRRMVYRSLSNHKQWGANEERGKKKGLREACLVIACLFMADFGSILFVFRFVNKIVNKMNALPVSNLRRVTATRFWRGTARRGRVSRLLFRFLLRNWSKVGLETWKCSFHCLCISALFSISLCQYCRRGYTHKDFCEPLGLLAFAAVKLAGAWSIKIRRCNSRTQMYCI